MDAMRIDIPGRETILEDGDIRFEDGFDLLKELWKMEILILMY